MELTLVLLLLGLLIGLVGPDLVGHLRRSRVDDVAQSIALMARETFQRAVFSGSALWLAPGPDRRVVVRTRSPTGPLLEDPFLPPLPLPPWCEVEGLENAWAADPEGFCDPGPLVVRDREEGSVRRLRFRAYDAELVEESSATAAL